MSLQLQDTLERDFTEAAREHPEYCEALEKAWDIVVSYRRRENRWLMDSLFQERDDVRPSYIDVAFSSELVFQLMKGHLYYTGIDVKSAPLEKPEESFLNEITLARVEAPFTVEFRKADDGRQAWLKWDKPVTVHCHQAAKFHLTKELPPGSARLEIGYTRAITTGLVLKQDGLVARWPHGHNFVYLLYTDLKTLFEGITDLSHWLEDRI